MAGKVTFVIYTLFPTAPIIIGSRHYIFVFFYLGLLTTDVARSGQRRVPFLKPHSDRLIVTLSWPLTQLA